MLLKQIQLKHFRNFADKLFSIHPFLTVIIGENARGKTNLLEALYFLVNGQGFREAKEEELIQLEKNSTIVEALFGSEDAEFEFKVHLEKKLLSNKKDFYINKTKKRFIQYVNDQTKVVLFSPEQLEIITGSPARRREYFNKLISLFDLEYRKRLSNFENALRRRNKILETYRSEIQLKEDLEFWDNYLEEQTNYIFQKREDYVNYLNKNPKLDNKIFYLNYLKDLLTKKRLLEVFPEEKRWRRTLIGPQKDDFQILLNEKNVQHFGSRSEKRLAIFWLKLNEIHYFEELYKKKPILLLDDIFSELDNHNRKIILDLIKKYQTIVTTTEIEVLDLIDVPKSIITL